MYLHDQESEQNKIKSEMTEKTDPVNDEKTSKITLEKETTRNQEKKEDNVVPDVVVKTEETIAHMEELAVEESSFSELPPLEEKALDYIPDSRAIGSNEEIPVQEPTVVKKTLKPKPPKPQAPEEDMEMMNLIEESFSNRTKGQIVPGIVVGVNDREVLVDIGFKSEGVIPISEFAYSGTPKINSEIMVYISETEDGEGKIHLSKKRADFILNIQTLKQIFENSQNISGVIRRRVKGGMIVDVLGIEGFLPGSQMSLKPIPNLDQFIGKEMTFKIISLDEERRNLILSRKKVLEEEIEHRKEDLLSHMVVGTELEGEVKNITQYGAFIDLGGIDGLLHLSDMSWGKINHPAEMLNIGDKLKVKVIHYDSETGKISLGLKQLVPHPWEHIEIKYPEGTRVTGKVVNVKIYGAFVEIEPGVEGLVHITEMSWTKKITDARRFVKVGDTVNAIVLELDKENRRISLGMKQMDANPWMSIDERYPIGAVLKRKIKTLTNFGAFVEIEEGIDGLIHISDISWTKRIYHPKEVFRKNQEVEAIVLQIDRALHRIALGVKQLKSDPWETLPSTLPVNTEVKGKISKLIPKGVLVDIVMKDDIVEGFVPISHLAIPKLEQSEDAFHVGEELPLKVIELDTENRRLILSVKAFFFSRDPKLQEEYITLHEQYMRDRLARQMKKKAEKESKIKDKTSEEKVAQSSESPNVVQEVKSQDVTNVESAVIPNKKENTKDEIGTIVEVSIDKEQNTSSSSGNKLEESQSIKAETPEPVISPTSETSAETLPSNN